MVSTCVETMQSDKGPCEGSSTSPTCAHDAWKQCNWQRSSHTTDTASSGGFSTSLMCAHDAWKHATGKGPHILLTLQAVEGPAHPQCVHGNNATGKGPHILLTPQAVEGPAHPHCITLNLKCTSGHNFLYSFAWDESCDPVYQISLSGLNSTDIHTW